MIKAISTKVKALDELFDGYIPGVLHAFGGETASGKTHITGYWPIVRIYQEITGVEGKLHENQKFIILDGDGGFDFDRFKAICKANNIPYNDIMKKHMIYKEVTSVKEQDEWIRKIIPQKIEEEHIQPLYLAVDPMIVYYRVKILRTPRKFRLAQTGEYTGILADQLIALGQIKAKYKIPVCVTSWPTGTVEISTASEEENPFGIPIIEKEKTPFIGGRAMGYMPKVEVILARPIVGLPIRQAFLFKHRSKADGILKYFMITDKGLADVPEGMIKKLENFLSKKKKKKGRKKKKDVIEEIEEEESEEVE